MSLLPAYLTTRARATAGLRCRRARPTPPHSAAESVPLRFEPSPPCRGSPLIQRPHARRPACNTVIPIPAARCHQRWMFGLGGGFRRAHGTIMPLAMISNPAVRWNLLSNLSPKRTTGHSLRLTIPPPIGVFLQLTPIRLQYSIGVSCSRAQVYRRVCPNSTRRTGLVAGLVSICWLSKYTSSGGLVGGIS